MKKEEKEYYLRIINIQESIISGLQSKNFSKVTVGAQELEKMKKNSFETEIQMEKQKKEMSFKRFKNLLSELESVVKDIL